MYYFKIIRVIMFLGGISLMSNFIMCNEETPDENSSDLETFLNWNSMVVTASAYNSLELQGTGNPRVTAWGDTLVEGMKSIAVSQDLMKKGLKYQTPVRIQGLEGVYIVNDKMHPRWKNKIDIYMGLDRQKALEWGRRKVEICFPVTSEAY